jgi:hypothetical protein
MSDKEEQTVAEAFQENVQTYGESGAFGRAAALQHGVRRSNEYNKTGGPRMAKRISMP